MTTSGYPTFLTNIPCKPWFGTSGLRGLVCGMTDLEVYINTRSFLNCLHQIGDIGLGDPIALAQDLREVDPSSEMSSSPRIALAVTQAIRDAGLSVVNCGKVPTPALAYYAQTENAATSKRPMPGIMVTGSHVPADRNCIKFYKQTGEVRTSDEAGILAAVKALRTEEYAKAESRSAFDFDGKLNTAPEPAAVQRAAEGAYLQRYLGLFPDEQPPAGKRVVVYQDSAVGRDLLVRGGGIAFGCTVCDPDLSEEGALGQMACRQDRSVLYKRVPRLFTELEMGRGDGVRALLTRRGEDSVGRDPPVPALARYPRI